MGKRWAEGEQLAWLMERYPTYVAEKLKGNKKGFLVLTHIDWFKQFPERKAVFPNKSDDDLLTNEERSLLADAIVKRKAQLTEWFNWKLRSSKRGGTGGLTLSQHDASHFIQKIHSEVNKTGRAPHQSEIYMRLFSEKVKEKYNALPPSEGSSGTSLNRFKAVAQQLLDNETEAVKEQVQKEVENFHQEKANVLKSLGSGSETNGGRTPEEYQSALKQLPTILTKTMEALADATGWSFTILCGGPVPQDNGMPYADHHHFGPKTQAGYDFSQSYPNFRQLVQVPFTKHILDCYPIEVRRERSLGHVVSKHAISELGLLGEEKNNTVTPTPQLSADPMIMDNEDGPLDWEDHHIESDLLPDCQDLPSESNLLEHNVSTTLPNIDPSLLSKSPHIPCSQLDSAVQSLTSLPSEDTPHVIPTPEYPGGPTEPLSLALMHNMPQGSDRDNSNTVATQAQVNSDHYSAAHVVTEAHSVSHDYTIQGASLVAPSISGHPSALASASQSPAHSPEHGPSELQWPQKKAKKVNEVVAAPSRVGSRNRRTANLGIQLVADPSAPKTRVKPSWSYVEDPSA